jgi:predicted Rossmann fold nucleotide-binding protein DprA/Smf involved in DNA uptake
MTCAEAEAAAIRGSALGVDSFAVAAALGAAGLAGDRERPRVSLIFVVF